MTNTPRTDEQALYDFRAYVRQITGAYYPQLETLVETILKERPLPHTPSSDWEKRLKDLKCVNGAMYFGSVEDDSCDCKTRCQNEQTYEHALEELTAFIRTHIENARREEWERIKEELRAEVEGMRKVNLENGEEYALGDDYTPAYDDAVDDVLTLLSTPVPEGEVIN